MSARLRALLTALAIAALVFSIATLVVRTRPLSNFVDLVIATGSPYVSLLALAAVALSALCHRKLLSIVAAAVVVAAVTVQVPWYYFGRPIDIGQHTDIRVLSSNLRRGQADASSFVGLAKESADVITVSEVTAEEVLHLSQAGLDEEFPYSLLSPRAGSGGIGLWSRFPIAAVVPAGQRFVALVAVRLQVPGVRFDPLVASLHIASPFAADQNTFVYWQSSIGAAKQEMESFADAAGPGAVIVAGDFNSTPDMRQFRDLLTNGYRDAVEQTGAGFAPTFPVRTWHPPLITIDHMLTRQAGVSSIQTIYVPGSDHRALLAKVKVPLDPAAS